MAVLQLYGLPVLQADHPGLRDQSAEGLRSLPVDGNNPLTGGDGAANRFYSFHTGVAAGVELDKGIALQKLQQPPYFFRPCFFREPPQKMVLVASDENTEASCSVDNY